MHELANTIALLTPTSRGPPLLSSHGWISDPLMRYTLQTENERASRILITSKRVAEVPFVRVDDDSLACASGKYCGIEV